MNSQLQLAPKELFKQNGGFPGNVFWISIMSIFFLVGCCLDRPDARLEATIDIRGSDVAHDVVNARNGGYVLVGSSESSGSVSPDISFVITDVSGKTRLTEQFGGTGSDVAFSVSVVDSGGYIVAGSTESFGSGGRDAYLLRLDEDGGELWSQTYGGEQDDVAYSVVETDDGGFVFCGFTESFGAGNRDLYLVTTDSDGSVAWTRTFGGMEQDIGREVIQATDGGYVVVGSSNSSGRGLTDAYVIKVDAAGDLLWDAFYEGEVENKVLDAKGVRENQSGDFIVLVDHELLREEFGARYLSLTRFNPVGLQVDDVVLGSLEREIQPQSMDSTLSGGYVVACNSVEFMPPCKKVFIALFDSRLRLLSSAEVGHAEDDQAFGIHTTPGGEYVIAGATRSGATPGTTDMYLIQTDDFDIRRLLGP